MTEIRHLQVISLSTQKTYLTSSSLNGAGVISRVPGQDTRHRDGVLIKASINKYKVFDLLGQHWCKSTLGWSIIALFYARLTLREY